MFPVINHINDVTRWIKNNKEIVVNDKGDYTVIKYNVVMEDTFAGNDKSAKIRCECRGICFDKDGNILSRPYHKFFNLNEKAWTKAKKVDWSKPHVVLAKLDGSMIHPILIDGKIHLCTKAGITDTSANAEEFIKDKPEYKEFIKAWVNHDFTPIFEWVSKQNKIVLDYEDNLILTGIRSNKSGMYVVYSSMVDHCDRYNIPVVDKFDSINDIESFINSIQDQEAIEGFVVRFDDGLMIKIKLPWYVLRHRSKEILDRPIDMIRMYLDNEIDDFRATLIEEDDKNKLQEVIDDLEAHIYGLEKNYESWYRDIINSDIKDKKSFSISEIGKNLPKHLRSAIFWQMDGNNIREYVFKYLKGKTKSITTWKEYREGN